MARTPSKEAHEKVLKAVLTLIGERGVEGTSMDSIAAAAGVSKATVYKHWENKEALLIDAVRSNSLDAPAFDSPDTRKNFVDLLSYLARNTKSEELSRVWPRIISYAASNSAFGRAFQERLFEPRRRKMTEMLDSAVRKGELQPGIEPELAADMLIGPIMHRRFVSNHNVPADLPEKVVDAFYRAFGASTKRITFQVKPEE